MARQSIVEYGPALGVFTALAASGMFSASVSAALISDDFDTDSSSDYTLVTSATPDSTIDFAFDYGSLGIASAPNTAGGSTLGLRITANDTAGEQDAVTLFHDTFVASTAYLLQVDMYLGVTGTTGTTEHAHIGVAGDGATLNQLFSPISGSGHYLAITGDGGSASDYRHFTPSVTAVPSGDPSYLNSTNTTNATGDTYQALFPGDSYEFAGSPGNAWTTVSIEIGGGLVTYSLDGTPIIQTAQEITDGYVSLGHADLFTSVATPEQSQFVIYDNLSVTLVSGDVPAPATLALVGLGVAGIGFRRWRGRNC